jgi:hypothetical protein
MITKHDRLILFAILALAVLLRIGVAFYLGDIVDAPPNLTDQRSYHALGARLIDGHGFSFDQGWYPFTPADTPTAHWSFLQSLYVAAVYAVFGVHPLAARLLTALLGGLLLPWMILRLTRRTFPTAPSFHAQVASRTIDVVEPVPLLAALLAALYPYFILYAATLMTETFYLVALLWSLERAVAVAQGLRSAGRADTSAVVGLGVALGVATLFRQSILPWVVVLFVWLLWVELRAAHRLRARTLLSLTGAGLLMVAFIVPFTVRNDQVYGEFLLLNSNAGFAMYSAQHPMHGTDFREFDAAPLPGELRGLNEAQLDRELMRRGIGFVMAEPQRYLLLSLSRVKDYVAFWPSPDTTLLHNVGRLLSFGILLPFVLYGIVVALRQVRRARQRLSTSPVGLLLLFALFYSVLHVLTWAFPRYRLPVDAVLMPFAALAIVDLITLLAGKLRRAPAVNSRRGA